MGDETSSTQYAFGISFVVVALIGLFQVISLVAHRFSDHFLVVSSISDGISWARDRASDAVDYVRDVIPDFNIFGHLRSLIEGVINMITSGFLDAIGQFFLAGLEFFLIYDNPRHIAALNSYWYDSLTLYIFIILLGSVFAYSVTMLVPSQESADLQTLIERLLLSWIFLIVSRDLFALAVSVTNDITLFLLPDDFVFYHGMDLVSVSVTAAGSAFTALLIAIVGGLGIFISGIVFYLVLAMRMLVIYVIYSIIPVLVGFWTVNFGPAKYVSYISKFSVKITLSLMFMGIGIAAVIAVGAAFADPGSVGAGGGGVETQMDHSGPEGTATVVTGDSDGPVPTIETEGEGGEVSAASQLGDVVFALFMFLGTIWLAIALTLSAFGPMISAVRT